MDDNAQVTAADLEAFFVANLDRARRLAWRLVNGDEAAAADVVQEAFVKAFHGLADFRGDASLATWFYRILVREAHNHRRWLGVRRRWESLWGGEVVVVQPGPQGDHLLRERIARALGHLGATQREVFVLIHLEGFTVRETAELLGKAEGTVKTHLHRALRRLRDELSDLAGEGKRA